MDLTSPTSADISASVSVIENQIPGFTNIVCPANPENPRNTEGSIIELKNGKLLLAYSHFENGADDISSARIAGKYSSDGGRTWGKVFTLQENTGTENVMSASLLRLKSDSIAFFYLVKNASNDLNLFMRISKDETETWSHPICTTPGGGYNVVNNDRVIQLSTGRLIVPVAYTSDRKIEDNYKCISYYSDDEGQTWKHSVSSIYVSKRGAMEPGVVELNDRSLLMIIRTQLGYVYKSISTDNGDHWTESAQSDIVSPESPATIKRIPKTNDLLLIWNNNTNQDINLKEKRNPLTVAISKDEGKSWINIRNIEKNPKHTYAYTSVAFVGENVLLSYYAYSESNMQLSLIFRSIPLKWFYEK